MDRNKKFLKKLSDKEFQLVHETLGKIQARKVSKLDIKKLSGYKDVYRVRAGNIRIIFLDSPQEIQILEIARRNEKTYKRF